MSARLTCNFKNLHKCIRLREFIYKTSLRFYTIQPPEWLGGKSILIKSGKFDFPEHADSFEERMQKLDLKNDKDQTTAVVDPAVKNIGAKDECFINKTANKELILQTALKNRKNKELEKQSRLKTLQVPLKEVKCDWLEELGPQHIRTIADHYNIYKDLFDGNYFYPTKELKVHYDYDDEYVTPVYWGNFVLPNEASKEPQVTFSSRPDELWAVLMTNPDENLTNQNQEYIHWLVVNIPGNDLSKGQTLVKYMPPITPMGTGYHRNVFILFKQNNVDDFKSVNRVSGDGGANRLEQRQFSTSKFFKTHEKNLIPHSLAFFQSQWDESVRKYYRENLDMGEPVYEYNHPTAYHPPAKKYPHKEPFNVYLDRYRDKKDINEEVLRRKLSLTQSAFEPRSQALKYPLVHRNKKKYKPSWLLLKEEMMARKVDQFKDLE